jgi:hypothetical protein
MGPFDVKEFDVEVLYPCGHRLRLTITKSSIKKRRWSRDIKEAIDDGCRHCYREAFHAVEKVRKEVMALISGGRVSSMLEAVEQVTGDHDLRVAAYERVSRWTDNPLPPKPDDLVVLIRRAAEATPPAKAPARAVLPPSTRKKVKS